MTTDSGRVGKPTGLSQAEPQEGLGPTGFDPSRMERLTQALARVLAIAVGLRDDAPPSAYRPWHREAGMAVNFFSNYFAETSAREIVKLRADSAYQSRLLIRVRDALINVRDKIEDEGDRSYFGSTNDADDFREVVESLDAFKWDQIMASAELPDLYADLRALREREVELGAKVAALMGAHGEIIDTEHHSFAPESKAVTIARAALIASRDSDRNPQGRDAAERLGAEHESAGPKDIAETTYSSPKDSSK